MTLAVDPWGATVPPTRTGRGETLLASGAAWVLGAWAPAARVWGNGGPATRGAVEVVVVAAIVEMAMQVRLRAARWPLVAAVAVAGAVLTHRTVGATPALAAGAATVVAHAALVGWSPWPGHPPRRTAMAVLAVPLVVAADVVWFRTANVASFAVLVAVALVLVEVHHRATREVEAVTRAVIAGTGRVAGGIGAVGMLVVVVPAMYVPGWIARAWEAAGHRRAAGPAWRARDVSGADDRRDAVRPFASASARTRRRRVTAGLAVVVALSASLAVVERSRSRSESSHPVTPALDLRDEVIRGRHPLVDRPAADGLRSLGAVVEDQSKIRLSSGPGGSYSEGDDTSGSTNIVGGERRTLTPPPCTCRPIDVWFTGGSAAFGSGQRDSFTIASDLVRDASADHVTVEVHNLGVIGWTLWEEYQGVLARLALQTGPRPDLVVFYDGFNDVAGSLSQAVEHGTDWSQPATLDGNVWAEYRNGADDQVASRLAAMGGVQAFSRRVADRYASLRDLISHQLAALGVRTEFFFQPDALASSRQLRFANTPDPVLDPAHATPLSAVLRLVARQLEPGSDDLRRIYDGVRSPIFLDLVHTNERGAALAASAIYRQLRLRLGTVTGRSG